MYDLQFIDTIKVIKYLKVLQQVWGHRGYIIREPCTVKCLDKNYKNGSIGSVDMDKELCSSLYMKALPLAVPSCTVNYTHAQCVRIFCHNTDPFPCQPTQ